MKNLEIELQCKKYNRILVFRKKFLSMQMFYNKISNINNIIIFEYITEKSSYRVMQLKKDEIKSYEIGSYAIEIEIEGYKIEIDSFSYEIK